MILLIVPAAAVAALSLAAFAGRWVWWLDVLANFRAQYALVLTVLGVIVVISRWKRSGIAILAVAAVNIAVVAPLFLGSPGRPDPTAPTLRVLSFNLLSDNESFNEVIDYIRDTDADLVFLHEASRPWEVALDSADLGYRMVKGRSEGLIFGTVILVKGEADIVSYGFAAGQARAVSLTYVPEGWPEPVTGLSTHPLAPTNAERAGLRDAQLGFAADWAADQAGPYFVVGDLNATPWSWPFRRLVAEGGLRNSQLGFGLQPSFSARTNVLFRVPIDHLLTGEGLRVRDRRLGPNLGSDHFPLVVDLELVS